MAVWCQVPCYFGNFIKHCTWVHLHIVIYVTSELTNSSMWLSGNVIVFFSQNQDNVLINYGLNMFRKFTWPCSRRWIDDINAIWTITTHHSIYCGLLLHSWVHSVTWFSDHADWVCGQRYQIGPTLTDPWQQHEQNSLPYPVPCKRKN